MAHIVIVGNEKGGSGKSTTAMHLLAALMRLDKKTAILDLDLRQRSLTRYLENRVAYAQATGLRPLFPEGVRIEEADALADPDAAITRALDALAGQDFVVVDAPGADNPLSRAAHVHANTVVTPLNDSFIDFDVLGRVDPTTYAVTGLSHYSEMVFEAKKARALARRREMDWVVLRNRVSVLNAKNKRRVGDALEALANRVGFRVAPGLSDRVVFREMFPKGLTLLDAGEGGRLLDMSRVAARQELRDMVAALALPGVDPTQI